MLFGVLADLFSDLGGGEDGGARLASTPSPSMARYVLY